MNLLRYLYVPFLALLWVLTLGWATAGLLHAIGHEIAGFVLRIPRERSLGVGPALWSRGGLRLSVLPGAYVAPRLEGVGPARVAAYLLAGPLGSFAAAWGVLAIATGASLWLGEPAIPARVGHVEPGSPAAAAGVRAGDAIVAIDGQPVAWWDDVTRLVADGGTVRVSDGEREVDVVVDDVEAWGARPFWASAIVGVEPESPAARAGLRTGDVVRSVNGEPVSRWHDVEALGAGASVALVVERGDATLEASVEGGLAGLEPIDAYVGDVLPQGPAAIAGLQAGDRLVAIDGRPVAGWNALGGLVAASEGRPLEVTFRRDGVEGVVVVRPDVITQIGPDGPGTRYVIGVRQWPDAFLPPERIVRRHGVIGAMRGGAREATVLLTGQIEALRNLFVGEVEVLGGPVAIVREAQDPQGSAASRLLRALALVLSGRCLVLGAVNLLPLPYTDSFAALDQVARRTVGRALPHGLALAVALVLLFGLFGLVLVGDMVRFFGAP